MEFVLMHLWQCFLVSLMPTIHGESNIKTKTLIVLSNLHKIHSLHSKSTGVCSLMSGAGTSSQHNMIDEERPWWPAWTLTRE